MIILFKDCPDVENCESFKNFGFIYCCGENFWYSQMEYGVAKPKLNDGPLK